MGRLSGLGWGYPQHLLFPRGLPWVSRVPLKAPDGPSQLSGKRGCPPPGVPRAWPPQPIAKAWNPHWTKARDIPGWRWGVRFGGPGP